MSQPKLSGNLAGMRSYTVGYNDPTTGARVFLVQFFMDIDGTIGASGLEDPKWLHEGDFAYVPDTTGPPE